MRLETLDRISLPNFSVRIMLSLLREHGLDPVAALQEAGIEPVEVENAEGRLTGRQELDFQHAFVRQTGHTPTLWVRTGLRYSLLSYGTFGLLITTASSVRRSVELATLFSDLNYSLMRYTPLLEGGMLAGLNMESEDIPASLREFSLFRDLGSVSAMLRENGIYDAAPMAVELSLPRPDDADSIEAMTGCRILFGANRNVWRWQPDSGDRKLALSSAQSEETYVRQCRAMLDGDGRQPDFASMALSRLACSNGRYLSFAELAQACSMSARTLHRRLAENGTSYRSLLDEARFRAARELLQGTRMTIAEIAENLGYSEVSSLSRSFRRWSGKDPTTFRQARH